MRLRLGAVFLEGRVEEEVGVGGGQVVQRGLGLGREGGTWVTDVTGG